MTIQLKAHIFSDTGSHKKAAQHQLIYDFQRYITTALLISFMDSFSYIFFSRTRAANIVLIKHSMAKNDNHVQFIYSQTENLFM